MMKVVQMLNGSVEVADMVLECCFGAIWSEMMSKVSNGEESESQFHDPAVAFE